MARAATLTIRPDSMPTLPEFLPIEAALDPDTDRSGFVDWVESGVACGLNPRHRFRPYRRRHHCRACGLLVCASCSRSARPLRGFGFADDRPKRLCDWCAVRPNADLAKLATFWQAVANKNVAVVDLADAMNAVYQAGFRFAVGDALNWASARHRLMEQLRLEIGLVRNLLTEVGASVDLTVAQIDDLVLRRAHRLMATLSACSGEAPLMLPDDFRHAYNQVVGQREHSERREAIAFHHSRLMDLLKTPMEAILLGDVVDVWGQYQEWAEANRQAVSKALEGRVRELLNRVVRRDQAAANADLELALNSKDIVAIRKAMGVCDAILGVLVRSPYRDHVMPDIHIVIPGFAAHRRSAQKLIDAAARSKALRRELRKTSLYPPKRI